MSSTGQPLREVPEKLRAGLEEAAALFVEKGYEKTSIQDVVEATSSSRTQLYYYFSGKADIVAYLVSRTFELAEQTSESVRAADFPTARDALEALLRVQLEVAADHRHMWLLAFEHGRVVSDATTAGARLADIERGYLAPYRRLLRAGQADGSLHASQAPERVALAIYGAFLTTCVHALMLGLSRDEIVSWAEAGTQMIVRGVSTRAARG